MNIQIALQQAHAELAAVEQPQFEAQLLLASAMECDRAHLFAHPSQELTAKQAETFQQYCVRRRRGEPVAYLLGEWGFWNFSLQVSPTTLIPRPETELLVATALDLTPPHENMNILELGTGSGAIALAIASERPLCRVIAVDNSSQALIVASTNAERLQLANVSFIKSDWFAALNLQKFTVIVSNPPYIAQADPHLTRGDLRFEPQSALVAGEDGLAALRWIIQYAPNYLVASGWLCVEHGADQKQAVQELFQSSGFQKIRTFQDLNQLDRVTLGQI